MPDSAAKERLRLIDTLHHQYSSGMPTLAARWNYWRKRLLWRFIITGSHAVKRVIDLVEGFAGLILLAPLLILTALLIKLEDGGPVLFRQLRVGRRGKLFAMYKFRSMRVDAESIKDSLQEQNESGWVLFKMRRDPRITRIGRIIRKLSIDEMPQFWNVIRGDMSLVGPRPPVPSEVEQYSLDHRYRLEVKPGITCLWQIGGRSELSFEQQVALDKLYIESQSLRTDLIILLKTIPAVLSGRGAY